ncbi:MAG TPA: sodium:solute symporter [Bacteroidia bacterium]|nr:sodium:solute symporter [Bacteroidia bacterium]HRG51190.1 sodium:solute symporter [Bacteroidia bacterium]
MSSAIILTCVIAYSVLLFAVTWYTSRGATNESYYVGNRSSKWYLVAYGMIGASLSGVTFISVPGAVGTTQFGYLQVVLGYLIGYFVIAYVLLPLYYRLNLTSIYTYLQHRFGFYAYKTGAFFFILSRTIGAAFRLYIVVNVLQTFVFDEMHIPFFVTVAVFIALILVYTYQGGVKTIVYTDTLQTTFMLLSVVLSIYFVTQQLHLGVGDIADRISNSGFGKIFFTGDWRHKAFFPKQFFGGMFIAIAMTGLDQEMMQKNISCKTLGDAQKNVITFSSIMLIVNVLFLVLGALLYIYAKETSLPLILDKNGKIVSDAVFPTIALHHFGTISGVFFIIGLISAAYPSADGALTALTSVFCIDFLGLKDNTEKTEEEKKRIRYIVHFSFAAILLLVIVIFKLVNDDAVINKLFTWATYTYGPLLGLYSYGLFTKRAVNDKLVPWVCVLSPVICVLLNSYSTELLAGYSFGFEMIIVNGFITFLGLGLISKK